LVQVTVLGVPDLNAEARLDAAGEVTLPVVGTVALAGRTVAAAEQILDANLAATYLRSPQVHVVVKEFAAEPVTVLGAVKSPGIYSARLYPTLPAMVAAAGGVLSDSGDHLTVTHANGMAMALSVEALVRGAGAADMPMAAGDVVRVLPAATVYIGGDVNRPGTYPIPPSGLTVLEALTLAGGLRPNARARESRIVHAGAAGPGGQWLDLDRLQQGRIADPVLRPFDLLYVPHSPQRALAARGLETAVNVGTTILSGLIIFH